MKLIRAATVPTSLQSFLEGCVEPLSERFELVLLASPGEELEELAARNGVRAVAVPMERRMAPLKDLVALWRLVRVFRHERPDIVHSMTPKAGLLCMVAAWMTRVPRRVHTFTGLVWPTAVGWQRRLLMATDWLTCACATHVIPEGRGVMHDLQTHITRKSMRVLGYGNVRGVDMSYWRRENAPAELLRSLRAPGAGFTFLFVGRLVGDKGIAELVSAFEQLAAELPGARLLLVGRAEPELDPLPAETGRRLAAGGDTIRCCGEVCGRNLLAYYVAADCLVLPSYREGFPNVVLEAGAMGLPCIVTDINGSPEIIEQGMNGLIVPPRDAAALLTAMRQMATDADARARMAAAARPLIAARYEQSFVRRCLFDFYDEILTKPMKGTR